MYVIRLQLMENGQVKNANLISVMKDFKVADAMFTTLSNALDQIEGVIKGAVYED